MNLSETIQKSLLKAISHLEYSFHKVSKISLDIDSLNEEDLEAWEGFVSRFSRVSDLFLSKYLRYRLLQLDPAFRGEFIDVVNKAEKNNFIQSASDWKEIRELRNFSVHEYAGEKLHHKLERMLALTPQLIEIKNAIK